MGELLEQLEKKGPYMFRVRGDYDERGCQKRDEVAKDTRGH